MTTASTTLPKQIQKQIDDAKALITTTPQETPEGNTVEPTPVQPTSETTPQHENGNTVEPTPEALNTTTEGQEPTLQVEPQPEPQPQPQPSQDEGQWEHMYKVLHGKYNAEVPTLKRQVAELTKQLETLQDSSVQATPQTQPQSAGQPLAIGTEVTDDLVRQVYGQDMIDEFGIDYWKAILEGSLKAQSLQSSRVPNDVNDRLARLETRDFYSELATMVPDLAELDEDKGFIAWLQNVDPISRRQYHGMLQEAEDQGDSIRAAAIFDTYKQVRGQSQATTKAPAPVPNKANVPSVASQVAPSGGSTTVQPAGPTMSLAEWSQQKASVARMAPTNPVRAGQLKKTLDTAMSEGRVLDAQGNPVVKTA